MDNNYNWYKIGSEIRDAVEASLRTGDFSNFGNVVSDTVNGVVDEAKRQVQQSIYAGTARPGQGRNRYGNRHAGQDYRVYGERRPGQGVYRQQPAAVDSRAGLTAPPAHKNLPRPLFRRKGDISSVLLTVFGGIGTGISAVGLVVFGAIAIALLSPAAGIFGTLLITAALGGSISMIGKGASNRKRLARAERYLALCRNHNYVNISELAMQTGKSENYVRKDVKRMVALGMFPQGHLDKQESCLMLSDDTYREYLAIERERSAYELEEFKKKQTGAAKQPAAEAPADGGDAAEAQKRIWRSLSGIEDPDEKLKKENPKLAELICQGQECTGHIRQMNDRIPGEVISNKLSELEGVLKEIFNCVREHPKQMGKLQKFMDYYLPTTRKLVEAYEEFDSVANPNAEILQAKEELEKTLDTINQSFKELLNQLYQESVFDATTDAAVLKTMLAKDGLAKEHTFDIHNSKGEES